jgi:hypothetical protein
MWEDAPYSALTATLKIGNVTAEKFPEEPCSYGLLVAALRVPGDEILPAKSSGWETAAAQATAPLASTRAR